MYATIVILVATLGFTDSMKPKAHTMSGLVWSGLVWSGLRYASDLTAEEWNLISSLPPPVKWAVPPENPVGRRIRGFSDRDWIPSLACKRSSFFSSFQHSATASVGAQPSSLSSLLFGISSPR